MLPSVSSPATAIEGQFAVAGRAAYGACRCSISIDVTSLSDTWFPGSQFLFIPPSLAEGGPKALIPCQQV